MSNVLGVGIDLVSIKEIKELDERTEGAFVKKTYSGREVEYAEKSGDYYQFLAGRFAVKEAVYKSICGNFPDIEFDFRRVETLKMENGAPVCSLKGELKEAMEKAGASDIKISISNQDDYAIAIAELLA
ncbi:MAG: holo-ACP synthase [Lachnospiraceae bacterium]|nr:holo-ACP synthase [Lachnospiraceae bacterium]